jgi:hypothetical protein
VAVEQVDAVQRRGVDAARPHEGQRTVDLTGDDLVAHAGRRRGHEVLVPVVDGVQVGQATPRVGADHVHRRGRVRVGAHQPVRVRDPLLEDRLQVVDHVAAVRRQAERVGVRGSRLRVLTGHPADLDHRNARPVRQDDGHLQQRAGGALQVRLGVEVEGLRAVAALQQERLAPRHVGQPHAEVVDLAGRDDRRHRRQRGEDGVQRGAVRPQRLLGGRQVPPPVQPGKQLGETHGPRVRPPRAPSRGSPRACERRGGRGASGGPLLSRRRPRPRRNDPPEPA